MNKYSYSYYYHNKSDNSLHIKSIFIFIFIFNLTFKSFLNLTFKSILNFTFKLRVQWGSGYQGQLLFRWCSDHQLFLVVLKPWLNFQTRIGLLFGNLLQGSDSGWHYHIHGKFCADNILDFEGRRGCPVFGPGCLAFTETPPQFNFVLVILIRWGSEYQGCLSAGLLNVWYSDGKNHAKIIHAHYTYETQGKLFSLRISTKTSNDIIAVNGGCDFGGVNCILVKIIHSHGTYTIAQNELKLKTSTEVIARNGRMTPSSHTGYIYSPKLTPRLNTKTSNDTIARIGDCAGIGKMHTIFEIIIYHDYFINTGEQHSAVVSAFACLPRGPGIKSWCNKIYTYVNDERTK